MNDRIATLGPAPTTATRSALSGQRSTPRPPRSAPRPRLLDRVARRLVLGRLGTLGGGLAIEEEGIPPGASDRAAVRVLDPRAWSKVAFGGAAAAGEAYVRGWWDTPDLVGLLRHFVRDIDATGGLERGSARVGAALASVFHALRRNTRPGSRRNITAHYDLGNEFYALMLDRTLTYSCAFFGHEGVSLEEAQAAKLDRICRKLHLGPRDHLLEIGTGWGSLALHAARNYGCRVTTTTISRRQLEVARTRVERAGLAGRVTVLERDYRDLEGSFSKIASVEMIEAVGHEYHERYFEACASLLAPDGAFLMQAIVIRDDQYDRARREIDFIKKFVFPGCCIPSISRLLGANASAGTMRLFDLENLTPHYATTLARWRDNVHANRDAVLALGYDEEFLRLWDFYLAYCEAGFAERYLGSVQMLFGGPAHRRPIESRLPNAVRETGV